MPKKRRKRIAADSSPEIPYPRVRVEWIDCVSDSGWATDKEFDKMKLAQPVMRVGYIQKIKNLLSCLHLTIKMRMVLLLGIGR